MNEQEKKDALYSLEAVELMLATESREELNLVLMLSLIQNAIQCINYNPEPTP